MHVSMSFLHLVLTFTTNYIIMAKGLLQCCLSSVLQVFDLLMGGSSLVNKLAENTKRFRAGMKEAGFTLKVRGREDTFIPLSS